jgi:hypothetical protein
VPDAFDPDGQEVLILAALRGGLELVVDLVGPDFRGVVGGSPEGTLLHHAAWVGDPELVRELLARGADATAEAGADTPLAWAAHGSIYHEPTGAGLCGSGRAAARGRERCRAELARGCRRAAVPLAG